jgi:hypothetical protein
LRKEVWSSIAEGQERGAGYILWQLEEVRDYLQGRAKEMLGDNRQTEQKQEYPRK